MKLLLIFHLLLYTVSVHWCHSVLVVTAPLHMIILSTLCRLYSGDYTIAMVIAMERKTH